MGDSQFSNIKNVIGQYQPDNTNGLYTPTVTSSDGTSAIGLVSDQTTTLSPARQVENYDFFAKEIMDKGVYLPDLVKKIDSLEAEIERLKANAKSEVDTELFEVMESKVRDVQAVKDAKHTLNETKAQIINEMCQRDPRYQDAMAAYRKAVATAYREIE